MAAKQRPRPQKHRFELAWFVFPLSLLALAAWLVWVGAANNWSQSPAPTIAVPVDAQVHDVALPEGRELTVYVPQGRVLPQCRWVDRASGEPVTTAPADGRLAKRFEGDLWTPARVLPPTSGEVTVTCRLMGEVRDDTNPGLRLGEPPNVFDHTGGVRPGVLGILAVGGSGLVMGLVMLVIWLRRPAD